VTYTVSNLTAGTYRLVIAANADTNCGQFQLAAGASGSALTNVGAVQDTYAATNVAYLLPLKLTTPTNAISLWTNWQKEFDCGNWTAPSNGNYNFQLTVTGKNAASSGYALTVDFLKFAPATGVPHLGWSRISSGDIVFAWPTTATGCILQSATNLTSPTWQTVTPPPVASGGNFTVTNTPSAALMFFRLVKP
jgi:hypothetical protein